MAINFNSFRVAATQASYTKGLGTSSRLQLVLCPVPFHAHGEKGSGQTCTGPVLLRNVRCQVFLVCVNKKPSTKNYISESKG